MYYQFRNKPGYYIVLLLGVMFSVSASRVFADFLELPDIKEAPQSRNRTLLRDIDIPPLRERSPDPSAGPRVAVSEFRIQGLVEYPELGITREALAELVEKIRFDLMAEGKQLESGYTVQELGQVSDLLVDIEQETLDRHVTPSDVQRLVFLIRDQLAKRGVTIGQIETVANRITTFYRERGFILAKAYIPKQQVRDGIVNLTLLLGMLGDVNVNNNKLYSSDIIKSAFDDLLTKPVTTAAIEERLFLLNDYPGISVEGYFEPGYQVGDTKLNINVKDESPYSANIRIDNHGSSATGRNRLYADAQFNNLLGQADTINLAVLRASSPSNTTFYRAKFGMNVLSPRFHMDYEISKNQFVMKQPGSIIDLDIHGIVDVQAISGRYFLKRGRTENHSVELRHESVLSDLQLGDIPDTTNALDDKIQNNILTYNFDFLQEGSSRLHQGYAKLTSGSYVFGNEVTQDKNYTIYGGGYTLLTFWKVPLIDADTRLVFRTDVQYAGKNLSNLVRFSLAGPTRARAYEPGLFTVDDGIHAGVDWYFNSPDWFDFNVTESINLKNIMKPFVFADAAWGKQYSLLTTDQDVTGNLIDAGLGLQFSYSSKFQGNIEFAFPIKEKFTDSTTVGSDKVRLVVDFQYSF